MVVRYEPLVISAIQNDEQAADEELAALALHDPAAFSRLYDRFYEPVWRLCYLKLGDAEAAEDAASAVFLRALNGLAQFRPGNFRGWLFAIAYRVISDEWRRARPTASLGAALPLHDVRPSPELAAETEERARALRRLLEHLPAAQREVVELRLVGLSPAEAANALGRSRPAVRMLQTRAFANLRNLVAADPVLGGEFDVRR